ITGGDLESRVTEKLEEARPQIEMKGFRKGKVPMALLKKQFGPRLMGEAMQEAVDGAMQGHLDETGDRPAMQPEVRMVNEDWKEGDDVVVAMSYERLPEIPEIDYKSLKLERLTALPTDADLDEALGRLAENVQNFAPKKGGKAAEGDQVVIDFVGKIDGEPFEGGAAEDYPLVLGSDSFIPGFEDQLIGAKKGEEKALDITFPENYGAEHLAGKAVVFEVTVKEVKKPVPAEIDDEMAKKFGAEDLDALKGRITEQLRNEYAGAARAVMKRKLLDQLDETVHFDLPPSLVDAEAGQIAHQLWHEENPEVQGHDHPEIEPTEEHRRLAERRVKLGLLLAELGTKNEIKVSDAEMSQAVMAQARQYPGQERAFFEFIQKNQAAQQQIRAPLFEDKVVDFVFEMAEVTEKEVTKDELKEAVDKLEEE
ncbi:MAG: trigger factor, partial [Roseicyclus sp.]